MLNRFPFLFIALLLAPLARADINNLYIPFGVMGYDFDSKRDIDDKVFPEIGLGYRFNEQIAAELMLGTGKSTLEGINGSKNDIGFSQFQLAGLYFFNDWHGVTPYALAGLAHNRYEPDSPSARDNDNLFEVGAGLMKSFSPNWSARAQLRGLHSLDENADDLAVDLLLQYRFGGSSTTAAAAPAPAPAAAPALMQQPAAKPVTPAPVPAQQTPRVEIRLSVNFDTNSDVVQPQYNAEVKRVADFMNEHPKSTATIEGHTDNRGNAGLNQKLSQRRADAIRNVLVNTYHVDAARVKAVGYGKTRPIADNKTADGQYQNRRVVASFEHVNED